MRFLRQFRYLHLLPLVVTMAMLLAACASMGRPEGGPKDEYPPVFLRSNPPNGTLNFKGNKITLYFDENISLDNPGEKVVISPAQKQMPKVSANGHRITVELRDSLIPNTTYTIDFADAIKDLNEGNVLDGFAIDFSTGDVIDSLRISGMVLAASNLEPAQGMLVGCYLDRGDTAIYSTRFDRITKTNQLGQFTLRNLKHGSYRVYALKDNNRDLHWDRTEEIAFLDSIIVPYTEPGTAMDTIFNDKGGIDSVFKVQITRFLPNDVLLTWFNENYLSQYLKEYTRLDRRQVQFILGAPSDTFPTFTLLNGPRKGENLEYISELQSGAGHDTLTYWLTDPLVINQDSLLLEARYLRTDSSDQLVWKTDTLKMNMRKDKKKDEKKNDNKKGAGDESDSIPPIEYNQLSFGFGSSVDLNQPLVLKSATPLAPLDSGVIHMEMLVDTVWTPVTTPKFHFPDDLNTLQLIADYEWKPSTKYRLTVDSAAVYDAYDLFNRPLKQEFTTKGEGDYGALYLTISGVTSDAVVELLNSSDKAIRSAPVKNGKAEFLYVPAGTYYVRLYFDRNANGKWDTGNLRADEQPEEVYYMPKAINLRKNWDVEQVWSLYDTPVNLQKPDKIKKNKPKLRPGEKAKPDTNADEEDEYDELNNFGTFQRNPYDNNNSRGTNMYNPNDILRRR